MQAHHQKRFCLQYGNGTQTVQNRLKCLMSLSTRKNKHDKTALFMKEPIFHHLLI